MGKLKKVANATKKTAKWAVPVSKNSEAQIKTALGEKEVRNALEEYMQRGGDYDKFVEGLMYDIEIENYKHRRLRGTATALDTTNKALVPVDVTLDAFGILAGVGTGARAILTAGKMPAYLAYDTYYALNTGDVGGAIKNLGWEAISWLVPGSLTHLINRYTKQADVYSAKQGGKNYTKRIKKSLDAKIIQGTEEDFKPKRKQQDLEELAA